MSPLNSKITFPDIKYGFLTVDSTSGVTYVSDKEGNHLKDEEGFVTYVGVSL